MKRLIIVLSLLIFMFSFSMAAGEETDPLSRFAVRNGRRDVKKIALTVDDAFDLAWTWKIRDMFHELGVVATFFPIGVQIHKEDASEWQKILDYGNEIGSHNMGHYQMGRADAWSIITSLGRFQQTLDEVLGYHYQVQAFRPPFGNITDENNNSRTFRTAVETFGYDHVILWDVSQTDPEIALRQVQNGSILLYHARMKDGQCMEYIIPRLLEEGYQFVTVSQLLDLGENEISPDPYVFSRENYEKK